MRSVEISSYHRTGVSVFNRGIGRRNKYENKYAQTWPAGRFTNPDLFSGNGRERVKSIDECISTRTRSEWFAYHDNAEPDKSGKTVANGAIRPS